MWYFVRPVLYLKTMVIMLVIAGKIRMRVVVVMTTSVQMLCQEVQQVFFGMMLVVVGIMGQECRERNELEEQIRRDRDPKQQVSQSDFYQSPFHYRRVITKVRLIF